MKLKELKTILSRMTFGEKIEYLWMYYKWVLAVALAVIVFLSTAITAISNIRVKTIYNGMLVNVSVTEEGNAYLTEDWFRELEGNEKRQKVELNGTYFLDTNEPINAEMNYASTMKVTTLVMARELDYFLMDEEGLAMYRDNATFSNMEESLTQEQIALFSDSLIYGEHEEFGVYPVAVDITDTAFAQNCTLSSDRVYLGFCGNTGRTEMNSRFFQYLLEWK